MASHVPGVWGIDLGLCALKAIRLETSPEGVKATAFDYIEHPKILSQPDADPDQLTREALETFLSRNNLRGDMIVVSVPGQSGLARFVKLPPVEERKIADIVKFEAKQQIPFPLDEVVWDFQKIGTPMVTDGLALETEIGLFAMKKDMVNRALMQFKDVKVEVHVIQMAPLALINYLAFDSLGKNPPKYGEEPTEDTSHTCVVALDIGTDNSNLVITDGEKIIWQRPIPLGGNHFTRALTKEMKLTFAKAEHLKRNAAKSPELRKILAALKAVLSDFVGEVQRSLGYFTNTHRDAEIKYMVGLGGAFRLPGLQKFLQEKLQLEVRKITKFERLQGNDVTVSPQFNENILSFAVPYGLALQGLKQTKLQTNLLPYDVRVERLVRGKKPWAAAAAAALLIAVAGLTYGKNMEKTAVTNGGIKAADELIDRRKKEAQKSEADFKALEEKLEKSRQGQRKLVAGLEERFNWQSMMQFINMTLPTPEGERLSNLSSQNVRVKEKYYTVDAKDAWDLDMKVRLQLASERKKEEPLTAMRNDLKIKQHLVQISIEGVSALYCDDIPNYFKNIATLAPKLTYMKNDEKKLVREVKEKPATELTEEVKKALPDKAWVVEIRGYTYHHHGEEFVKDTIVENLRYPEMVADKALPNMYARRLKEWGRPGGSDSVPQRLKEKELREQVLDQISYLFLYKLEQVENPVPGQFEHIKGSHLAGLLKPALLPAVLKGPDAPQDPPPGDPAAGPKKVDRGTWKPWSEVASAAFGFGGLGGPGPVPAPGPAVPPPAGAGRQPRWEFIVLFLWKEPLKSLEAPPEKKEP